MIRSVCVPDRHACANCPFPLYLHKSRGWMHNPNGRGGGNGRGLAAAPKGACSRPSHYLPGCSA